jgi:hypothetical protein
MIYAKTPWRVETYFEPYNSRTHTYQVVSDDGLIMAKCGTGGSEVASVANLISAAPDMLEALERVKASGVFLGVIPQGMVDDAIAKAKGEK